MKPLRHFYCFRRKDHNHEETTVTNPSFFVPLLSEFDVEMYEELLLDFLGQRTSEESETGMHCIQVPKEREVLAFACEKLLGLTTEQCTLLIEEVPETKRGSPEHRAVVRRIYDSENWCKTAEHRTAAYMLAIINTVIARYNSKIVS